MFLVAQIWLNLPVQDRHIWVYHKTDPKKALVVTEEFDIENCLGNS
jgi:hypothetical protein